MTKKAGSMRWDATQPLDLSSDPFGWTEEGYRDFRGAPINRFRKVLGRRFVKCDLSEADFSNIELEGLQFTDCRFNGTNFASTRDNHNQFVGCLFTNCSFDAAYLGMRPRRSSEPSLYEDCVFEANSFRKALFRNAIFRRIVFKENRTQGVDFCASGFWYCRFIGLVENVWFRGSYAHPRDYEDFGKPVDSGLHGVDFSQARLVLLAISDGCALDSITLPADGSCILVDVGRLLNDRVEFSGEFGEDGALVMEMVDWLTIYAQRNGLSTPQDVSIVCRHDLEAYFAGFTESSADLATKAFERIKALYAHDL